MKDRTRDNINFYGSLLTILLIGHLVNFFVAAAILVVFMTKERVFW